VIEMARKSSWRVGQTRRKYRKVNGKRRLCNVTKTGKGYAVKVVKNPTKVTIRRSKRNKDFWVVSGGPPNSKSVNVMDKKLANRIASARKRIVKKRY